MARALRTDLAGALHHVSSRGNERRPTFYDDNDREVFFEFLGQTVRRFAERQRVRPDDESLSPRHPDLGSQPLARRAGRQPRRPLCQLLQQLSGAYHGVVVSQPTTSRVKSPKVSSR
jgi:hypothetical protein